MYGAIGPVACRAKTEAAGGRIDGGGGGDGTRPVCSATDELSNRVSNSVSQDRPSEELTA